VVFAAPDKLRCSRPSWRGSRGVGPASPASTSCTVPTYYGPRCARAFPVGVTVLRPLGVPLPGGIPALDARMCRGWAPRVLRAATRAAGDLRVSRSASLVDGLVLPAEKASRSRSPSPSARSFIPGRPASHGDYVVWPWRSSSHGRTLARLVEATRRPRRRAGASVGAPGLGRVELVRAPACGWLGRLPTRSSSQLYRGGQRRPL